MTVRADVFERIASLLRAPATSAEGNVFEHRAYALEQGTPRALIISLNGAEEEGEGSSGAAEARLLPVSVIAIAHSVGELLTLCEEVDMALFQLHREGKLLDLPAPQFATPNRDGEGPVFEASWTVPLWFRLAVDDPSVET